MDRRPYRLRYAPEPEAVNGSGHLVLACGSTAARCGSARFFDSSHGCCGMALSFKDSRAGVKTRAFFNAATGHLIYVGFRAPRSWLRQ